MNRKKTHKVKLGMECVYLNGRKINIVSHEEAARLLRQKKAVERYCGGLYMGISLTNHRGTAVAKVSATSAVKQQTRSVLEDADARRSCVVLSRAEVEAIADRTRSRTECLTEAQRDARVQRGLAEMDLAERARKKFGQMFGSLALA